MSKSSYESFIVGQIGKTKTPIKSAEKLNEAIADHENKIYSLATDATRLRDRLESLSVTKPPRDEIAKIEGAQRAQEKYEYHIKNLENDKTSLSKRHSTVYNSPARLNIVLMELDKITAEKADYERQLADHTKVSGVRFCGADPSRDWRRRSPRARTCPRSSTRTSRTTSNTKRI